MRANQYPCCEHCKDDQPHIEADSHDLPCDINGCQVMRLEDVQPELDRLRAEVERMRPVIEAATAWYDADEVYDYGYACDRLSAAVHAYRAALDAGEPQ